MIAETLRAAQAAAGDIATDWLVVDSGSPDGTAETAGSVPGVRVVRRPNRGFAAAVNAGITRTAGELVLVLNPDATIVGGRLRDVLDAFQRDANLGVLGIPAETPGGRRLPARGRRPAPWRHWAEAFGGGAAPRAGLTEVDPRPGDAVWVAGAAMVVRRAAIDAAGLLDERFFLYREETDWCLRIGAAGWSVRSLPLVRIVHDTPGHGDPVRAALLAQAKIQFADKHFSRLGARSTRAALVTHHALRMALTRDTWRRRVERSALHAAAGHRRRAVPGAPAPVVILLDNHHEPERRAAMIKEHLTAAGGDVRIVAWDRRPAPPTAARVPPDTLRVSVPAPPGGRLATLSALARFCREVWSRREEITPGGVIVSSDIYLLPFTTALARARGASVIYDAREDHAVLEERRWPRHLLLAIRRAETALARRASVVVVPSSVRSARWEAHGIEPVVLLNVGLLEQRETAADPARWDVAACGMLNPSRRLDLLLALAERRPDLQVVVTGEGRQRAEIEAAAQRLPNLTFLGYVNDVDEVLASSRVVYYGQDPDVGYSPLSAPNTLYQAVAVRRPLVFFCGGDLERAGERFAIGIRTRPDPVSVEAAIDEAAGRTDWAFDDAWRELTREHGVAFRAAVEPLLDRSRPSLAVLGGTAELRRARTALRRRGLDATRSGWHHKAARRVGIRAAAVTADPGKAWDVERTLDAVERHVPPDAPVLDVGAMFSEVPIALRRLGYTSLSACDLDARVLHLRRLGMDARVADAHDLPWERGAFAAVNATSVLEHGVDTDRFFAEVARVLRPGGLFTWSTDHWPEPVETEDLFGLAWTVFDDAGLERLLAQAARHGLRPWDGARAWPAAPQRAPIRFRGRRYTFAHAVLRRAAVSG